MRSFVRKGVKFKGCSVLMVARVPPGAHPERLTTAT